MTTTRKDMITMNADEARETLDQVAVRREQTLSAGASPWSGKALWSVCSYALALGVLLDAEMVWLWVILFLMGVGMAWKTGVTLRPTAALRRWQWAMAGTFGVALAVSVAVQFPVRALEWPLPNTIGSAAACLVIVTLTRSVQARMAASLRA